MNYTHIASRVLNKPLLLEPAYARVFFSAMASRLGIESLADAEGQILVGEKLRISAESYTRTRTDKWGNEEVVYQVQDGVASIPVQGTLVHKFGYLNPTSGMTGYDGILHRASAAFADPKVKAVLLDLDTPGGEVSGCFDTARTLRSLADATGKPLWALCCDMACSAGMALASSAHRRLITQTGVAGSVGVVMAHANHDKHLQEQGVEVTLIHSGAHKVDGNPYQALPSDVLERFQTQTHELRQEFAQIVSAHTGLSVEAVLATEAATYRGQAAVDIGFADERVNGHEAISIFSEHLSTQGRTISIGANMSKADIASQPAAEGAAPAVDKGTLAATGAGDAKAERARIAGILAHANAEGRGKLANHLALETDLSVEAAAAVLAQAEPERDTGNMETALDTLMADQCTENVSADAASSNADAETDVVARTVAAWKLETGAE